MAYLTSNESLFILFGISLFLVHPILMLIALIKTLRNQSFSGTEKLVRVLVIFLFPIIGSVSIFIVDRRG
ncbi:hypothetical protein EOJ36_11250 [Sandaracinomonas limnophila]|uniref:Cardiolipin synthase N-terminal domain-containing protein n=1 Tax=Sandaracinomonas limnophila TaxID=1862386 RepID=A0A437PLZ0_9BACT|nr:hypothetical protein [Sandaracinomonas limnophila]RVU23303.1 hypothetical protein EOJ36_11250 [Sandaracinomonas limnophila]